MRLSLSGEHTGDEYELEAAIGGNKKDEGLPHAELFDEFVDAVCTRDEARIAKGRQRLVDELGEAALIDTAADIAAFNGYPRAADTTGIPLEDYKDEATEEMRVELGLDSLNLSTSRPV
ncbi:MAG: hypothetical protein GKR93_14715 [Gammaproteobacteria bacterium]|nr:hypothetical protein [Gammaproteobacteria bacterium]